MLINNNSFGTNNLGRGAATSQNPCVVARPDGGTCTDPIGPKGPWGPWGPKGPKKDDEPSACIFGWGAWIDLIPHMIHVGHEETVWA